MCCAVTLCNNRMAFCDVVALPSSQEVMTCHFLVVHYLLEHDKFFSPSSHVFYDAQSEYVFSALTYIPPSQKTFQRSGPLRSNTSVPLFLSSWWETRRTCAMMSTRAESWLRWSRCCHSFASYLSRPAPSGRKVSQRGFSEILYMSNISILNTLLQLLFWL